MFEDIQQHRAAVAEQIQKACEIGFTGGELEKAHKVGDIHPNGKWVWTQLPSGRYDWRVIKRTSGGSAPAASATAQKKPISISANHPALSSVTGVDNVKEYLTTFNSKYTDLSKVTLSRTPKGNWDVRYDGHRLGILNGDQIPESSAKKMGWLKTDSKDLTGSKSDVEEDKKSDSFQSPKEIADFIAKKFGTKVKRINGTVSFGNWGDYGAYSNVGDCYEVQIDDLHKVRIGTVISATKSWMHCYKGEILMQTAVKKGTITGKRMFQWNKDGLTSYKPGSNFKDYLEKEYVGGYQKEIGKQLFQKK